MSLDDVLQHFKAGRITQAETVAWIELAIAQAANAAKLETLDAVEADIAALQARRA